MELSIPVLNEAVCVHLEPDDHCKRVSVCVQYSVLSVSLNARCKRVGLEQKTSSLQCGREIRVFGSHMYRHDICIRNTTSDYQICRETSGQMLMKPKRVVTGGSTPPPGGNKEEHRTFLSIAVGFCTNLGHCTGC